jgi:hypothetical protein
MEVRYHEELAQASLSGLQSPENFSHMQTRFDAGSNPSWAEWRKWAEECGLTPLNLSPTEDGIFTFLSQYGPIVYSGTWGDTFDGHVVIINGVDTDADTISIHDPLSGTAPEKKNMIAFMGRLKQTLWETPLFVYAP